VYDTEQKKGDGGVAEARGILGVTRKRDDRPCEGLLKPFIDDAGSQTASELPHNGF
jgi:hypothetical protein